MTKRDLIARFTQPSTWRGILYLLSAAGVALSPAHAEAIIALGMALAGAVAVFFDDAPVEGE